MFVSDVEMLNRWATTRDADAFAELVSRHAAAVYGACLRVLRNAADAEDVTQQCFVELAQRPPVIRSTLGGWLHRLATHRALNHARAETRRRERQRRFADSRPNVVQPGWNEVEPFVDEAIAALRADLREVIVLRYLRGCSETEAAEMLDIAPRTVRYRTRKGIERIRAELKRRGVPVASGLAAMLAANLGEPAQAAALPASLRGALGRIAVSGIAPRLSPGNVVRTAAMRTGAGLGRWVTVGAVGALAAAGAAIFLSGGFPTVKPPSAPSGEPQHVVHTPDPRTEESGAERMVPALEFDSEEEPVQNKLTGVVSDSNGQPLPNAALQGSDGETLAEADGLGRFAAASLPENDWRTAFHADGFTNAVIDPIALMWDGPVHVDATLMRPLPKVITAVDRGGRPVPGAEVYRQGSNECVAVTDQQGRFTAPDETERYVVKHPDAGRVALDTYQCGWGESVALGSGADVTVRVTWQGKPAAGARVVLSPQNARQPIVVTTDSDGTAKVDHVQTATGELLVDVELMRNDKPPLYGAAVVRVEPGRRVESDIALEDPFIGELKGRLVRADGTPIEGAAVWVRSTTNPARNAPARMEADGRFTAPLFAGANVISERNLGRFRWEDPNLVEFVATAETCRFEQEFRLVPRENRDVEGAAVVTLDYGNGRIPQRLLVTIDKWQWGPNFYSIDAPADGRLRLIVGNRNPWVVGVVDPDGGRGGLWKRSVDDGGAPWRIHVDVAVGSCRGVLLDSHGAPVPYALVESGTTDNFLGAVTQADASGRFELWPVPVGEPLWVSVRAPGFEWRRERVVFTGSAPARIVLERCDSIIAGQVVYDDGTPVPRGTVHLSRDEPKQVNLSVPVIGGAFRREVVRGPWRLIATDGFAQSASFEINAPAQNLLLTLAEAVSEERDTEALAASKERLKRFGLVFTMFAHERDGALFPALSPTYGAFHPEMKEIFPEYLVDSVDVAHMTGKGDVSLCYLGHLVDSEASGLAFLEAYRAFGPELLRGQDILVEEGQGSFGGDTIVPLYIDVEQGDWSSMSAIPLLWEVPGGPARPDGGWVLYMDGHVEWQEYPGAFPMTETFVQGLEEIRSLGIEHLSSTDN